ncbi:MAG TPA: DUF2690 domain-containing protein [Asanoa sp.]|nr:DUF2690 domain-containing protein [Asanoa sp.]
MKLRTMLSTVLIGLLMSAAVVTLNPSPAAAAGGCGYNCDDRDPYSFRIYTGPYAYYTCADDGVVRKTAEDWSNGNLRYHVQLAYSPRCQTAWAISGAYSTITIYVERKSPSRFEYADSNIYATPIYTRMVNDAGVVSRACLNAAFLSMCTAWY